MKNIKILSPINEFKDVSFLKDTDCCGFYVFHSMFLNKNFDIIDPFINEAKKSDLKFFVNFEEIVNEQALTQTKKLLNYLLTKDIDGILINDFAMLEFLKDKNMPFKIIIDSGLNIHNLSGIDFVNSVQKIENINITEEIYLKNIAKIKKYTGYNLSIDSDNLPWLAKEIKKSKAIDTIIVKGCFKSPEELKESIQLIRNILENPQTYKNKKLPFKNTRNIFYETNHFSGEFINSDGKDFKFSGNIKKYDWNYNREKLYDFKKFKNKNFPKLNLRLTGLEQITALKNYIKKQGFNPVYSIEYGEILSTSDLAKHNFSKLLEKIKNFCKLYNIKLQLSTPKILIERDFDRVFEYVKQLCLIEPYPSSIIINNTGFWWAVVNDPDLAFIPVELGVGLNLTNTSAAKCFANTYGTYGVDLSNFKDLTGIKFFNDKIGSLIPIKKLRIAGSVRIPSLGMCPLNSDSAILSRLSCSAPCHNGNYAIFDPSIKKEFPFTVDGFCRMHLLKNQILDLFKYIKTFECAGINEFVIDFTGLPAKLIPVMLNRFLNSLNNPEYIPDPNFMTCDVDFKIQ